MSTAKTKITAVAVALLALVTVVGWQQSRTKRLRAEVDALREQVEKAATLEEGNRRLTEQLQASPERSQADLSELLRLRGQSARMRQTEQENARLRAERDAQAAEAAQLQARLVRVTQDLARAESALADAAKLSPEELQQVKDEALSVQCVNSLKQIVLAAGKWAKDHNNTFPPDFISMKDLMATPKILFCPGDAAAFPVSEWSQLNPTLISYRLLNPNGSTSDPAKPLAVCPIHGHMGLSDASAHRQ